MMQSKNRIIFSAAGSGKTTLIVDEVMKNPSKKILIVTFTIHNRSEIVKKFTQLIGYVPKNVVIKTWYSFVLSDLVRPYQNFVYSKSRIESIFFRDKPASRYIKKTNIKGYYLNRNNQIDKDRLSDFAWECYNSSEGKVIDRLEEIYDCIFLDEVQDMAGYDLELFRILFKSRINLLLVGDIRQATYVTSNTNKNKRYKGINIIKFFIEEEKNKSCEIEYLTISHRCNQKICDFADGLYPNLPTTSSTNLKETNHDGVFVVRSKDVERYCREFSPQKLRYDARTKMEDAFNFGQSKGATFDRVLIKPTKKMENFLHTGELDFDPVLLAKFYVAVTRARHSVAFITDIIDTKWESVKTYQLISNICYLKMMV